MRLLRFLARLTLLGLFIYGVFFFWKSFSAAEEKLPVVTTTHHTVLQEITAMGKLELVKYNFKDIVEHEKVYWENETMRRIMPDILSKSKAVLIVSGEAIGCIDLTKIKRTDIIENRDTLIVYLPQPELCVYKINHDQSKVYDVRKILDEEESLLVNDAFVAAEKQIEKSALNMGIMEQTQENAGKILTPFLEKISGKKVLLRYRLSGDFNELNR